MKYRPKVFVGSSTEGLPLARAITRELRGDATVHLWDELFRLSRSNLENLQSFVREFALAILVGSPDDQVQMRRSLRRAIRDNILFELGMFLGYLPRERVFLLTPHLGPRLRIPSDLAGITVGQYDVRAARKSASKAVKPFCAKVRHELAMFGAAERRFVGPLMIRGLKAIGPEIQPIEDTRYEYRVHRAVVTISDGKVRITGRITERGQLKVRGRFSGEGVLEGETAYLLYVVQDDARRAVFRGAAYFRIPRAGASLAGYWMTDDALQTERKAIAVGDVRMGPGSSIG